MDFTFLIGQALTNGLIIGLLYLLMAIGFTLVFGVMRVVNFAHGEFYMLGAFSAYVFVTKLQLPFLAAVLATFVLTLIIGWLIEVLVMKGFRGDELNGMIATIRFPFGRAIRETRVSEYSVVATMTVRCFEIRMASLPISGAPTMPARK